MDKRLKLLLKILINEGKLRTLRSSQLVSRLMDEGPMARETAFKIIKEGIRERKIIRGEAKIGQAVSYRVYPNIIEDEKFYLNQMGKFLKDFDDRFSIFEDKFSSLSIDNKSQGVQGIYLFLVHFSLTVRSLWEGYEMKREWKTLINEVNSRKVSFDKLVKSRPKKEQSIISQHVLEGKLLYLDEAKGFLDEYLHEIK